MLIATSFIGSLIGFLAYYQMFARVAHAPRHITMRASMINCMALAFIFAMLIDLTTGSKLLSVILPIVTICAPAIWMLKLQSLLDVVELLIGSLMSVSMSVMLIGMTDPLVVWLIQLALVLVEALLFVSLTRRIQMRFK